MPSSKQESSASNGPAHAIRKHSLKASIWRNETRSGAMYNVTLIRTYKDGEEFKDTPSLGFDDLANAGKILADAETWIGDQLLRDKEDSREQAAPASQRRGSKP